MKYMNYTAYKNLKLQTQDIQWAIYLPAKKGPSQTSTNSSLVHSAISLLKKTLKKDKTANKSIDKIVNNLRSKVKEFSTPLKGNSILIIVYTDGSNSIFDLPLNIDDGYITDIKDYFFKPLTDFYNQKETYYFLELHQKGCDLYEWDRNGIKKLEDPELSRDISSALKLDEPATKSLRGHYISNMNNGLSEGFHGQGGFKDRRKDYVLEYLRFIDRQLSNYSKKALKPIILVGSKQLSYALKKISHNKHLIKGYMTNLPTVFDVKALDSQIIEY